MKKIFTLLILAGQINDCVAQTCNPLDPGFGINGKATGLSTINDWVSPRNIFVQPDNKIIQIGSINNSGFTVIRYTNDGHADSTFGQNGKATAAYVDTYPSMGALQSDGKIVVVGSTYSSITYYFDITLARFNSDGTPDNSFGSGGKVVTPVSSRNDEGFGLAIQGDGKIVVGGGTSTGSCFNDCYGNLFCIPSFTVLRYNSNGTLDATFGQGGISAIASDLHSGGRVLSVIVQPDGKIVATGERLLYYCDDYYGGQWYSSGLVMARYSPDGNLDGSFGENGIVKDTVALVNPVATVLQPDGKIVATGRYIHGGNITKRYHSDGKLDNGFVSEKLDGWINDIDLLADGQIVLGGGIARNNGENFLIVRLNNDGSLNNRFNGNGTLEFRNETLGSGGFATGVALQDDNIIAGGFSYYYNNTAGSSHYDQFVVRLSNSMDSIIVAVDRSGPLYPCLGESVVLSLNQPGNFQWYKDGELIIGATDSVFNATAHGYYSVKVSSAGKCGQSPAVPVLFNSLPVTIIPDGGLNICEGDSVRLVSNEPGILQWFKDGYEINGATDTAYTASTAGYYSVGVKNSKGCGQSSQVYVTVNPDKPVISWFGAILQTNGGYYSYQWYLNGNAISGANENLFHPADTGLYRVVIEDYGCNNISEEFNLNCSMVAITTPQINWDGANLTTVTGYENYQWYLNGNPIAGSDTNFFQPAEFGRYTVTAAGNLKCINTSNEFVFSCDVAGPTVPWVDWNGTQFFTVAGYAHYQWYQNDTAIAGATSNTYTPGATQFGDYKVVVTNNYNCSSTSDSKPYQFTALGDIALGDASFRYYPNPVGTTLFIEVSRITNKKMTALLYDLSGKKLKQQEIKLGQNQIQVEQLTSGLYQLEVQYGLERKVLKVVVIK